MNNLQFDSVYVLGDTHRLSLFHRFIDLIPNNSLLIGVGDHGEGFGLFSEDEKIYNALDQELEWKECKLFTIRGNHTKTSYYTENKFPNLKNIELIKDYTYKTINNKVFLFVGGAVSVDRLGRKEGVDWWSNEGVEYLSGDKFSGLKKCDVLITHSAPDFCSPVGYDVPIVIGWAKHDKTLIQDLQKERQYLTKLCDKVKPKLAYRGHFHASNVEIINRGYECRHHLLDIGELREVIFND
jgi:hypothetical protein